MEPTSERIRAAARHLFARYGHNSVEIAKEYVVITARSGDIRDIDEALLVLTELEHLAERPRRDAGRDN
jgi:hypothetical protein